MKRYLPVLLVSVAFFLIGMQTTSAQTPTTKPTTPDAERIAKVKKDLSNIGVGKEVTVSRKDNRDFFGRVQKIGVDDFEIIETDSNIVQIFKYEDIKNVRSGDGKLSPMTGKRNNSRLLRIVAFVAVGVLVAAIVIVVKGLKDPRF